MESAPELYSRRVTELYGRLGYFGNQPQLELDISILTSNASQFHQGAITATKVCLDTAEIYLANRKNIPNMAARSTLLEIPYAVGSAASLRPGIISEIWRIARSGKSQRFNSRILFVSEYFEENRSK